MNRKEVKDALRSRFRKRRKELDPLKKKEHDLSICSAVCGLPEYKIAKRIFVYSPIKNEIDLTSLFEKISEDGKACLFPRCFEKEMKFASIGYKDLLPGSYGIPEPPLNADYTNSYFETDVCILPCLCADRNGFRLGYGGGYYDRFLKYFSGIKVIAVYKDFIVDENFSEAFDIPADIIVTEEEIIRL